MTTATANPDLLAILAAGPKPGEWSGPYRVEAYALDRQHWRNPARAFVFASNDGRLSCGPLAMWLDAKRTGGRFGFSHVDPGPYARWIALAPPVGTQADGEEIVAIGLHHATTDAMVAHRDRAGRVFAETAVDWLVRHNLWDEEAGRMIGFPVNPDPVPNPIEPPVFYHVLRDWTRAGDTFEPGAVVRLVEVDEARGYRVERGGVSAWSPPSRFGDYTRRIPDAEVAGWGGAVLRYLPLGGAEPTPVADPVPVAKAANLDAIRAMLAAGPMAGAESSPFRCLAFACNEATAHDQPGGLVFMESISVFRDQTPRWWVYPLLYWDHERLRPDLSGVGMERIIKIQALLDHAPAVGTRHHHYKGGEYEVVAIGVHVETFEVMVAYRCTQSPADAPEPITWARTLLDWSAAVDLATGGVVRRFTPAGGEVDADVEHPTSVEAAPEYPYEAFIAQCPSGDRTWGDLTLDVGDPVLVVRPAGKVHLIFQPTNLPRSRCTHALTIRYDLVVRERPMSLEAPPEFPYEAFIAANCPKAARTWNGYTLRVGEPLSVHSSHNHGGRLGFLVRSSKIADGPLFFDGDYVTREQPTMPPPPEPAEVSAVPRRVPWLPKPGDRYRNHNGLDVVVGGTAHLPDVGLVVLHDLRDKSARKHRAAFGAVPIAEWHGSIQMNDYAVRRFTPSA